MLMFFEYTHSAFELLAVPWPLVGDGIEIAEMHVHLSKTGDDRLSRLATDLLLSRRIKIESLYETAVIEQEEDAFMLRSEEALIIPDDIDYLE